MTNSDTRRERGFRCPVCRDRFWVYKPVFDVPPTFGLEGQSPIGPDQRIKTIRVECPKRCYDKEAGYD